MQTEQTLLWAKEETEPMNNIDAKQAIGIMESSYKCFSLEENHTNVVSIVVRIGNISYNFTILPEANDTKVSSNGS